MTALIEFADSPYYFDPKSGRYKHRQTNRFASRKQVLALLRENIKQQGGELINLADRLDAQELTLRQFQEQAADLIKRLHVQSAILGHDGIDNMSPTDWLEVARELRRQYHTGQDPQTGKRFGLKYLAASIRQGSLSLAQVRYALSQFAKASKISYYRAYRTAQRIVGKTYAIRILGNSGHCPDCIELAKLPPQSIDQIVLPTQSCRCRVECKCTIQPLTLQEAVAKGLSPK